MKIYYKIFKLKLNYQIKVLVRIKIIQAKYEFESKPI